MAKARTVRARARTVSPVMAKARARVSLETARARARSRARGMAVFTRPVNNDPTSWINEEMADHQTKAQLDGKVGHIVQPTFHKFD
jgi:hypothetical protein